MVRVDPRLPNWDEKYTNMPSLGIEASLTLEGRYKPVIYIIIFSGLEC